MAKAKNSTTRRASGFATHNFIRLTLDIGPTAQRPIPPGQPHPGQPSVLGDVNGVLAQLGDDFPHENVETASRSGQGVRLTLRIGAPSIREALESLGPYSAHVTSSEKVSAA